MLYADRRNGVTRYATPLTSTDDLLSPTVAGGETAVDERGSSPPLHFARRPLVSCAFPLGSADEVFSRVVLCHLHGHHLAMFFLLIEVFSHVVLCHLHGCHLVMFLLFVEVFSHVVLCYLHERHSAIFLLVEVFSRVVLCHLHGRHLMVCSHQMYHSAGCHLTRCSRPLFSAISMDVIW